MFMVEIVISAFLCNLGQSYAETVVPVTTPVEHGEGPHWDYKEQVLYYVDTFAPTILRWEPQNNGVFHHKLDGDSVGIIVPIKNRPNEFIVCRDRYVDLFSWNGKCNNSGTLKRLTSVDKNKPYNQFNDGKADAKGRLWAGTLTRNEDLSVSPNGGSLFKLDGYTLKPINMFSPVSISNGIAWSKDNNWLYYIDSETRKVTKFRYHLSEGLIGHPTTLFDLEDHKHLKGIPDGMTIDTDDNLWVALYGGKSVIKINSTSGKLLQIVDIPATYVTSVAFGGHNFDVLYVTTSKLKLTLEEQELEPDAGCVFAVYNLGVRGLPANDFRLSEKTRRFL
ncbi:hypothetical protein ILUMI_11893 [Ignelater luminosus]|uniref:Regucalcin n=1 Tax=Ignelater luminosus TaxID=2038154 RepID=A0A8K0CV59_IGNLU|nr:hypothetical protein ILUMI_11893 [Ignelater luminosus]